MVNEALYDIIDGEETYVGFCYVHQGRRVIIEGEDGCQHKTCLAYRDMPAPNQPMFNIRRLKNQNAIGQTSREQEKEIIEQAEKDGREIQRPTF